MRIILPVNSLRNSWSVASHAPVENLRYFLYRRQALIPRVPKGFSFWIGTEALLLWKVHPVKKKLQQNLALPQIQWAVLSKMCQPAAHAKYTVVAVQYCGQIHSLGVFWAVCVHAPLLSVAEWNFYVINYYVPLLRRVTYGWSAWHMPCVMRSLTAVCRVGLPAVFRYNVWTGKRDNKCGSHIAFQWQMYHH